MTTISLEFEAKFLEGPFGDRLGAFGYVPRKPHIVDAPVSSDEALKFLRTYLDTAGVPYKVDGMPFNEPNW